METTSVETSNDVPKDIQPESVVLNEGLLKKKRKSPKECEHVVSSALPIHYILMPVCASTVEMVPKELEPKAKKKRKTRAVTEASTAPINLWRKVTEEVTGDKKIVKKNHPEYQKCLAQFHEEWDKQKKPTVSDSSVETVITDIDLK